MTRFSGLCLLILILLASVSSSFGQHWQEGYVVTYENDTLRGYIKKFWPYTTQRSSAIVEFKTEKGARSEFFEPDDAKAYKRGEDLFVSGLSREFYAFLQIEESGDMRLLRYSGINHLSSPRGRFSLTFTRYYLARQATPQHLKKVRKENFTLDMSRFFRDMPELSQQIRTRQLRYRDLDHIVEAYNQR